jgi:hypothetical protein
MLIIEFFTSMRIENEYRLKLPHSRAERLTLINRRIKVITTILMYAAKNFRVQFLNLEFHQG